jgi:hypothetical protein
MRAHRAQISHVNHFHRRLRAAALLGGVLVVAACGRADRRVGNDTALPATPPRSDGTVTSPGVAPWPAGLGAFLVVAGEGPRDAALLMADTAASHSEEVLAPIRGAALELFTRAGQRVAARFTALDESDTTECVAWPRARLDFGTDTARGWTVGAAAGKATPLTLDSLAQFGAKDSSRFVIDVTRTASALPEDTSAIFRGLPVIVRDVHRFRPAPGIEGLVAEVSRRVAQEAQPLEERILFIAERDSGSTQPWRGAWSSRVQGIEETIEAADVVAGLTISSDHRVLLVVQRESARGVRYELLERTGTATWTRRWVGPWSGC